MGYLLMCFEFFLYLKVKLVLEGLVKGKLKLDCLMRWMIYKRN